LYEGKCVRLEKGDFTTRKEYGASPAEVARNYVQAGAKMIHVVDLEGAKDGVIVNRGVLEEIMKVDGVHVQAGGGIRTAEIAGEFLAMGVDRVVVGSYAVENREGFRGWVEKFGPEKFCVALDIKEGKIATRGWVQTDATPLANVMAAFGAMGVTRFLSTDIKRDGMLVGPNVKMYKEFVKKFPKAEWYASGGVSSTKDLSALSKSGVAGVIVGKAIYENKISLADLFGKL
jgi:phosphoribosylformimino-5-aminoimidazole carboxamide ribotide isomerase